MQEFNIQTVGGEPITFTGQRIGRQEGNVEHPDPFERSIVLELYVTDRGGFVATKTYFSSNDVERAGCVAEKLDSAKEVENCFFVFVPDDLLPKTQTATREEQDLRKQLSVAIKAAFDKLTFAILNDLDLFIEQKKNEESNSAHEKAKPKGVWDMLRGKSDSDSNPQ